LFLTARALTDSWRLGATVAALWGMAPVQEGTLGWYSVFGHALAGTCTLWVLSRLMRWRSGESPSRLAIALAALVMIAGGSCFGVGIGTALVMPAIAWLLLPAGRARTSATLALASAGAFVALEYFTVKRLNLELFGVISLTTIPALPYLWQTLHLAVALAGYSLVAFALGSFNRTGLYSGTAGTVVLVAWVLLAALALVRGPRHTWRALLACALLAAGVYGMIAMGRLAIAASFGLDLTVQITRYHYVGMVAAALALAIVLRGAVAVEGAPTWSKNTVFAAWAVASLIAARALNPPINHFDVARRETAQTLAAIAAAGRQQPPGADLYLPNQPFRSVGAMLVNNLAAFPGRAAVFALFHPDDMVEGRRVFFVIDDPDTLRAARHGQRAARLLRGPDEMGSPAGMPQLR